MAQPASEPIGGGSPSAFDVSFLTNVVDSLADPVFVKDDQHRFVVMNDAMCRFMGRDRHELLGKSDYDFFPKEEADVFWAKDQVVLETGEPNTNEESFTDASGQTHTISTKKARFSDADGRLYLVGVIRNMTESKRVEAELLAARDAAEAAAREKSMFLANVSHELRTPLNAVIGMSGLLLDTPLSEEQQEYAATIRASSDALLGLINDVLDFSKVEAGKLTLERVPVSLTRCLDTTLLLLGNRARSKGLELRSVMAATVPEWIEGDATRIQQVCVNLLSNAIKFTEEGHVAIKIGTRKEADGLQVTIEVADTGPGIPAEQQALLFEPFAQGDASTTRRFGGTGLGLAISRRLCELMGGTLALESEPGDGATFTATLPATVVEGPTTTSSLPDELAPLPELRVLIVEDNPVNQQVVLALLKKFGLRADRVADGLEAVMACERRDYDLVLMDIQMPVMDGREATRRIRNTLPAERQPRIVALTASALEADREASLAAGMNDYLTKPLMPETLRRVLAATPPRPRPADYSPTST